jgi:hypothetical protein
MQIKIFPSNLVPSTYPSPVVELNKTDAEKHYPLNQ